MADWIEHDGKGMPVDGSALVFVRFPDGYEDTEDCRGRPLAPSHADEWDSSWTWPDTGPEFGDIVAYRLCTAGPEIGSSE